MKIKWFTIFIFSFLIAGSGAFFLYSNKNNKIIPILQETLSQKLNTENIYFFPAKTILFVNNIQLSDYYKKFQSTELYNKIDESEFIKKFSKKKKFHFKKDKVYKYIESELTFENILNMIGSNITLGAAIYETEKKPDLLLVLNLYNQGLFFEKLFELLEEENMTRNLKYSVNSLTVKIIEFKINMPYYKKLYYVNIGEKYLFSTNQKWIEDIINQKIKSDNSIETNREFRRIVDLCSIDYISEFYIDFNNLRFVLENYLKHNQKNIDEPEYNELISTLQIYKPINKYLFVNNLIRNESFLLSNNELNDTAVNQIQDFINLFHGLNLIYKKQNDNILKIVSKEIKS